jgi:lysophospholipase L1-like esterase
VEPNTRLKFFFAAMLLVTALVILVGGELLARQFYVIEPPVWIGKGDTRLSDEEFLTAIKADPDLMWRLHDDVVLDDRDIALRGRVSNGQGLREPENIPLRKADNELRILFIGESITFGWRVKHDQTFVDLTERALGERFPQLRVTAINAGVPAYSLFQAWRFLITEGFDYQPDLVVLGGFGFNDSTPWAANNLSDYQNFELWQARQPIKGLQWSRLAQLIVHATHREPRQSRDTAQRPRLLLSEFRDILDQIRAAADEQGAELFVVIQSHQNNFNGKFPEGDLTPYQRVLREFGEMLRLGTLSEPALLDGVAVIRGLVDEHGYEKVMFDRVHPTPLGHAALGEGIAARIEPWVETQIAFERWPVDRAEPLN